MATDTHSSTPTGSEHAVEDVKEQVEAMEQDSATSSKKSATPVAELAPKDESAEGAAAKTRESAASYGEAVKDELAGVQSVAQQIEEQKPVESLEKGRQDPVTTDASDQSPRDSKTVKAEPDQEAQPSKESKEAMNVPEEKHCNDDIAAEVVREQSSTKSEEKEPEDHVKTASVPESPVEDPDKKEGEEALNPKQDKAAEKIPITLQIEDKEEDAILQDGAKRPTELPEVSEQIQAVSPQAKENASDEKVKTEQQSQSNEQAATHECQKEESMTGLEDVSVKIVQEIPVEKIDGASLRDNNILEEEEFSTDGGHEKAVFENLEANSELKKEVEGASLPSQAVETVAVEDKGTEGAEGPTNEGVVEGAKTEQVKETIAMENVGHDKNDVFEEVTQPIIRKDIEPDAENGTAKEVKKPEVEAKGYENVADKKEDSKAENVEGDAKTNIDAPAMTPAAKAGEAKPQPEVMMKEVSAKAATKQSSNILAKVKQSLVKAKKAITGKSPGSKRLSTETKGEIKVK